MITYQQPTGTVQESLVAASSQRLDTGAPWQPDVLPLPTLQISSTSFVELLVGLQFTLVVPRNAVINAARMQFTAYQADWSVAPGTPQDQLHIFGELSPQASVFPNVSNALFSRIFTNASALWSPATWGTPGERALAQLTPDISSVIQEIVNLPTWTSGNTISIFMQRAGNVATTSSAAPDSRVASVNNVVLSVDYCMYCMYCMHCMYCMLFIVYAYF
jgi:hypothetical protein